LERQLRVWTDQLDLLRATVLDASSYGSLLQDLRLVVEDRQASIDC
jgi:hypothetical protein